MSINIIVRPIASIVCLSAILAFFSLELDAQWAIKNLDENSYSYETSLSFKNDSLGLMMGTNSVILKSNDVGETWNQVDIRTDLNITDFQFIGDSIVYAVGDHYSGAGSGMKSKLIKSVDNGDNWDSIMTFPGLQFKSLFFLNKDTGLVAGFDAILRTMDGGNNWDTVWSIPKFGYKYGELVDITFPGPEIGYSIGLGRTQNNESTFNHFLLKTVDEGITWDTISSFDNTLKSMFFLNQDTGFIGTEIGSIYKTMDGGLTWSEYMLVDDQLSVLSIQFISDQIGYATGSREFWLTKGGGSSVFHISKTNDGGENWETYDTIGVPLYSLYFIDDTTGFVSGLYNLIMKSNGNIEGLPDNYPWQLVNLGNSDETKVKNTLLKIYPNPSKGVVSIWLNTPSEYPAIVELYSITGHRILKDRLYPGEQLFRFDISRYRGSIFILKIETDRGPFSSRIIKVD